MKKVIAVLIMVVGSLFMFAPSVWAHELYIEVEEFSTSEELRVDVKWGHIRDYVSESSHEDYELFVRYPNGIEEQLSLEAAGVYARAYVSISEEGDYVFWAKRKLGTYTPEDGPTQLSNQMAKIVHHVGSGDKKGNESVGLDLEIVPELDNSDSASNNFYGSVLLDGEPVPDANITAYGPAYEILEQTTDGNGDFLFDFDSNGRWLVKANVVLDESGSLKGEDYQVTSLTSSLLFETNKNKEETNFSGLYLGLVLLAGLLIGSTITLFFLKKRSSI